MIAIFPEIAACSASGDLERLGILVRNYFGSEQKFAPELRMVEVLKNVGIEVQRLPLDSRAALLAKDEKGVFEIIAVLSEGLSVNEERFTLAHLLGHFLINVQPLIARGDWNVSGYREMCCPMKRYGQGSAMTDLSSEDQEIESIADDFAAATLMPKAMVKRAMEKAQDEEKVAAFFGVPMTVLRRRMQQIGVSSEANDPVNFIDAAQQVGKPVDGKLSIKAQEEAQQLIAPDAIGTVPKSFAAANYSKTNSPANPRSKATIVKSEKTDEPSDNPKPPQLIKGMDRIRELARQMDKGV